MSNDLPPTSNAPMSMAIFPGIEGLNTIPAVDVKAALHVTPQPCSTRVWRRFVICSAHYLPGHAHCGNVHGHNYVIEICVTGPIGVDGMIIDFTKLKELFEPIKERYDHTLLNDRWEFTEKPPTAENMAKEIFARMQTAIQRLSPVQVQTIRVSETPDCWAEYGR